MTENTVSGAANGGSAQRRGRGAQAASGRREFRRFRQKKKEPPISLPIDECKKDEGEVAAGDNGVNKVEGISTEVKKPPRPRKCRFFNSARGCKMGDECPFRHVQVVQKSEKGPSRRSGKEKEDHVGREEKGGVKAEEIKEMKWILPPVPVKGERIVRHAPFTPRIVTVRREERDGEEHKKIRASEIQYVQRRFAGTKTIEDGDTGRTALKFTYNISEPDWPFNVRSVTFTLSIEREHPFDAPLLRCAAEDNPAMPDVLVSHVEKCLNEEITIHHNEQVRSNLYTTYGKWLVKRIDKRILELFVAGLRKVKLVVDAEAAGITLVTNTKATSADAAKAECDGDDSDEKSEIDDETEECGEDEEEEEEEERVGEAATTSTAASTTTHKKEEVTPSMQMAVAWTDRSGNIATLEADVLRLVVKCARCGEPRECDVGVGGKKAIARCAKCSHAQSVTATRSLVHAACSTLANLACQGCKPIDCVLPHCLLKFVCLACNRMEDVQSLSFGGVHKSWCKGCHALCEFDVAAARFTGTHGTEEDDEAAKSVAKPKKARDAVKSEWSGLVDGQPLPQQGTCKHYRKSHRWFRFPCCGRLFPCDTCHEESVKGAHEMKVANRMVCGFCSFEQPFQTGKPCSKCNESTTRKRTQFWEGGKGCRDQKAMSKNDQHKFINSRQKTVSKKRVTELVEKKNSRGNF